MSTLQLSLVGFGSRLIVVLVISINTLLLARLLGPQDYGTYIIFIKVISVLTMVGDFGLSQSANAFLGRHEEWLAQVNRILLYFISLLWMGTIILGTCVLWLWGDKLLPNYPSKWMWLAFGILPASLYSNFWYNMMIGLGQIWRLNLVRLVSSLLSLVLTVIFVAALRGDATTAVMIYVAAMALQFLVMLLITFRLGRGKIENTAPPELSQRMLRFGLRGYLGTILYVSWVYYIPVFALNSIHGAAAVGIFSVGQQIVEKVLLPVQAMQDTIYKKMAVLSNQVATLTMNRYLRLAWWGMLASALIGILIAPWAIVLVLGDAYASAAQICRVLLLGVTFMSVSMLLDTYFINQLHRPGLVSVVNGVNVLISLLAVTLISLGGAMGAAWTLVLTQIAGALFVLVLYLRMTRAPVTQLLLINRDDLNLIRAQVGAILWRK
jgi:O-antigen/teichoic acid export membrane protein